MIRSYLASGKYVAHAQSRFFYIYVGTGIKHVHYLVCQRIQHLKQATVDRIKGKIVIILNRTTCTLHKAYMHYTQLCKEELF